MDSDEKRSMAPSPSWAYAKQNLSPTGTGVEDKVPSVTTLLPKGTLAGAPGRVTIDRIGTSSPAKATEGSITSSAAAMPFILLPFRVLIKNKAGHTATPCRRYIRPSP